jgi:hypothetical protein
MRYLIQPLTPDANREDADQACAAISRSGFLRPRTPYTDLLTNFIPAWGNSRLPTAWGCPTLPRRVELRLKAKGKHGDRIIVGYR